MGIKIKKKKKKELECNINSRREEIKKNYLKDKEKTFELEKRSELQHIASFRKKTEKEETHEKYITTSRSSKPTCNVSK